MRERLRAKPHELMMEYVFQPRIQGDLDRSFGNMMRVNMAHTLMLFKKGIIDLSATQGILRASLDLAAKGPEALDLSPEREDLYLNIEKYLMDVVGASTGGRLHTARSRNDLYSTITRMNVRESLLPIYDRCLQVRSDILLLAKKHAKTVMTGYTHMQPAQPTTLGHYLAGVSEALDRDYERLESAYFRLNRSPLGSAAFAGTSFDIDRHYTAKLLGFDGPLRNTLDSVASRDYLLEIAACFACTGSTISRFVSDLILWCTDEFGYIELDDSMSGSSSIMPQKKNPSPLEHIRGKSAHLLGAFVSICSCLRNIPFGHSKDSGSESPGFFWDAAKEIESMLALLHGVVTTLKVKPENMERRVNSNFCTATDLADELVRKEGLPFRSAYQVVGSIVAESHERGLTATDVTGRMLDEKAMQFVGGPLEWDDDDIRRAMDARRATNLRKNYGGPAEERIREELADLTERLAKQSGAHRARFLRLKKAEEALGSEVARLAE